MISPDQVINALKAARADPRGTYEDAGKIGAEWLNHSAQLLTFTAALGHERNLTRATQRRIGKALRSGQAVDLVDLIAEQSPAGAVARATLARVTDMQHGDKWPGQTTQESYHSVPTPKQGPITLIGDPSGGFVWSDKDQKSFTELWESQDAQEPLAHQLLREAKNIVGQNRRSALLICYSALEVGVKQHISNCVPDAAWLATNSPSPPLNKILRTYLPQLHSENQDFENWNQIKSKLSLVPKFTDDRNRLAHRGESIEGSIDDYLEITENLLYAFDVLEGHNWAKSLVDREFRELLGWNSADDADPRVQVILKPDQ